MIKTGITSGLSSSSRSGLLLPEHKIILPQLPNPELWCRYGQGITEISLGVDQWDDAFGNGNHLKQSTDLDRPQKQADGSILFDGIRQFLKADAFTSNQPTTMYLLIKRITWAVSDRIFDGNILNSGGVFDSVTSPDIAMYAGTTTATNSDLLLDTYAVLCVVFNGASSLIQIDNNTPTTGNAGTNNMGGFTLAAAGDASLFGHIQVKEVVKYGAAHNAETRAEAIRLLQTI